MSDFEHDDELRDAAPCPPAATRPDPTLAANRTRMARARSRRRAAIGSITAASFVAIGGAVFAANGTSDTNVVDVVAPPTHVGHRAVDTGPPIGWARRRHATVDVDPPTRGRPDDDRNTFDRRHDPTQRATRTTTTTATTTTPARDARSGAGARSR